MNDKIKRKEIKPNHYIIVKRFSKYYNKYEVWISQVVALTKNGVYTKTFTVPIRFNDILATSNNYEMLRQKVSYFQKQLLEENASLNFNTQLKLI